MISIDQTTENGAVVNGVSAEHQTTENGAVVNGVSAEHQTTRKLGAAMPPPERKKEKRKTTKNCHIIILTLITVRAP